LYDDDPPESVGAVDDERLRLIFTCCHPALAMQTRVALTLRNGVLGVPGRPSAVARIVWPTAYSSAANLERTVGLLFGGKLRTQPELVRHWHFRSQHLTAASLYRLVAITDWTSLPWLHTLRTPTLVVHGDGDPIAPFVNA
jgi:fermentation-respiration switch protein FrsA (DUF1100 family)